MNQKIEEENGFKSGEWWTEWFSELHISDNEEICAFICLLKNVTFHLNGRICWSQCFAPEWLTVNKVSTK